MCNKQRKILLRLFFVFEMDVLGGQHLILSLRHLNFHFLFSKIEALFYVFCNIFLLPNMLCACGVFFCPFFGGAGVLEKTLLYAVTISQLLCVILIIW